ncbi:hypothetical protein FRB95_011477 [Tulasnella sp. JGI-2019a]|nr:hypothetical protein FRB95_011477 [Tulasnella sp. JGI-2019a]
MLFSGVDVLKNLACYALRDNKKPDVRLTRAATMEDQSPPHIARTTSNEAGAKRVRTRVVSDVTQEKKNEMRRRGGGYYDVNKAAPASVQPSRPAPKPGPAPVHRQETEHRRTRSAEATGPSQSQRAATSSRSRSRPPVTMPPNAEHIPASPASLRSRPPVTLSSNVGQIASPTSVRSRSRPPVTMPPNAEHVPTPPASLRSRPPVALPPNAERTSTSPASVRSRPPVTMPPNAEQRPGTPASIRSVPLPRIIDSKPLPPPPRLIPLSKLPTTRVSQYHGLRRVRSKARRLAKRFTSAGESSSSSQSSQSNSTLVDMPRISHTPPQLARLSVASDSTTASLARYLSRRRAKGASIEMSLGPEKGMSLIKYEREGSWIMNHPLTQDSTFMCPDRCCEAHHGKSGRKESSKSHSRRRTRGTRPTVETVFENP